MKFGECVRKVRSAASLMGANCVNKVRSSVGLRPIGYGYRGVRQVRP